MRFVTAKEVQQAALKKTKVKIDVLADIDMLLMVQRMFQMRNMSRY